MTPAQLDTRRHHESCPWPSDKALKLRNGRYEPILTCRLCLKVTPADLTSKPREQAPAVVAEPVPDNTPQGRYWLGCSQCDRGTWLHNPKPRLAYCGPCRRRYDDARRTRPYVPPTAQLEVSQ